MPRLPGSGAWPVETYEPTERERVVARAAAEETIARDGFGPGKRGIRRVYRCDRCGHETVTIGYYLTRLTCHMRVAIRPDGDDRHRSSTRRCGGTLVGRNPDGSIARPPAPTARRLHEAEERGPCDTCGAGTGEACTKLTDGDVTIVPHTSRLVAL